MVYVHFTSVRLLRYDRNGLSVSSVLDLDVATGRAEFYEFIWWLGQASDVKLGHDPTATRLPDDIDQSEDAGKLAAAISSFPSESRVKPYIQSAFDGTRWPLYKLQVPVKTDPTKTREFLVRNPTTHSVSPTGRATKGYIAFDVDQKDFCFLKDSWRPMSDNVHPELDVYERLAANGVNLTATVRCGGDLLLGPGQLQLTRTQELQTPSIYFPRVHTRLVLNEVCIPLKHYTDSRELCKVVLEALVGKCFACTGKRLSDLYNLQLTGKLGPKRGSCIATLVIAIS